MTNYVEIIDYKDLIKRLREVLWPVDRCEVSDAIEEQSARIAELESLLRQTNEGYAECIATREDYRARIAALEGVLIPFAYDYGDYSDGMWSDLDYIEVTVSDLRAARAALGEKE